MNHLFNVRIAVSASVLLFGFFAQPVKAQTLDVPARDMAQFRQCLARAADQTIARTCDVAVFDACENRSDQPGTTISMSECLMVQNNAWDNALNEVWPRTLAQLEPQARAKLRAAQRLWISLRTADCAAIYEANIGGTIRGPASASCYRNATRDRYFWIKSFPDG
jgi:uncharacterized protein YecT (DUF1311 family)